MKVNTLPKRRYKSKWQRYLTTFGVLLAAIGGLLMIFLGTQSIFGQSQGNLHFLSNFITLQAEFNFIFDIITIAAGIAIIIITITQKPHEKETLTWIIASAILAVIGGTIGGLIVFGGVLIYLIMYFI